jgi:hypothetical protein
LETRNVFRNDVGTAGAWTYMYSTRLRSVEDRHMPPKHHGGIIAIVSSSQWPDFMLTDLSVRSARQSEINCEKYQDSTQPSWTEEEYNP